jgi:hypothetical protein
MFKRFFLRKKYKIIDDLDDSKRSLIEFVRGEYAGIIIKMGSVRFATQPRPDGKLPISFSFMVIKTPDRWYRDLQQDIRFKTFLVSIIEDLLIQESTGKLFGSELNFEETMDELF